MHHVFSTWHLVVLALVAVGLSAFIRVLSPPGRAVMPDEPQARKWFVLSLRDQFTIGGLWLGIAIMWFVQRHIRPEPAFISLLPLATMLCGYALGEFAKRMRRRNAQRS